MWCSQQVMHRPRLAVSKSCTDQVVQLTSHAQTKICSQQVMHRPSGAAIKDGPAQLWKLYALGIAQLVVDEQLFLERLDSSLKSCLSGTHEGAQISHWH